MRFCPLYCFIVFTAFTCDSEFIQGIGVTVLQLGISKNNLIIFRQGNHAGIKCLLQEMIPLQPLSRTCLGKRPLNMRLLS